MFSISYMSNHIISIYINFYYILDYEKRRIFLQECGYSGLEFKEVYL